MPNFTSANRGERNFTSPFAGRTQTSPPRSRGGGHGGEAALAGGDKPSCKVLQANPLNVLMRRLLGQVRQRIGRRTGVRRRGLWRPSPSIRLELGQGGQFAPVRLPLSSPSGLTGRTTV